LLRLFLDVIGHVGSVKRVFGGHGITFKVGSAEALFKLKFSQRTSSLGY
jgi:hypothetical protein